MDFPCSTCQYSNTPYVCEQATCEKYKAHKTMSLYEVLGEIAKQTVIRTMIEGEKTHPANDWQEVDIIDHICHTSHHENDYIAGDTSEDHIAHALTRCAMIKYMEG